MVIHAENLYFGDLDLEMEGLYFNIENELDLLLENLEKVGITDRSQMDMKLKTLIMRATFILINYE